MGSVPVFTRDPYNVDQSYNIPVQIDKLIGSAYDTVRFVAENIEYIKHVSAHMPQIYRTAASADAIDAILQQIALLDTLYQNLDDILIVANNINGVVAVGNNINAVLQVSNNLAAIVNVSNNMLAILSVVRDFADRAALKTYITANPVTVKGRVYNAGEQSYIGLPGSTLISDLPGLIVQGRVTPFHFGAKGDGIVDDTVPCNAASKYVFDRWGGGEVYMGTGRWLIDSGHFHLWAGTTIRGEWRNLAETVSAAPRGGRPWAWANSCIILNPDYSIIMGDDSCGIEGFGIFPKNLPTPVNTTRSYIDIMRAWRGKAINVGTLPAGVTAHPGASGNSGAESWVSHVFVVGFEWAIYSDFAGRTRFEWVYGDNKNGIYLSKSYDMQHLSHCHFWPFYGRGPTLVNYAITNVINNGSNGIRITLSDAANPIIDGDDVTVFGVKGTIESNNTWKVTKINATTYDLIGSTFTNSYASGGTATISPYTENKIGYNFDVDVDWGQADNCFCFGYNIGCRIFDAGNVLMTNMGIDQTSTFQHRTAIGILITGGPKISRAKLLGCRTAAGGRGIVIDTDNASVTTIVQHTSWGIHGFGNTNASLGSGIAVMKGKAIIQASMFWDLDKCIYIDPASAGAYASGNCNTGATPVAVLAPPGQGRRMSNFSHNAWNDASDMGEQYTFSNTQRSVKYTEISETGSPVQFVFQKARGSFAALLPPKNNDSAGAWYSQVWDGVSAYRTIAAYRHQLKEPDGASPTKFGGMHIWSTQPIGEGAGWDSLALIHTHLYPLHHNTTELGHSSSYWSKTWTVGLGLRANLALADEPVPTSGACMLFVNAAGQLVFLNSAGTKKIVQMV